MIHVQLIKLEVALVNREYIMALPKKLILIGCSFVGISFLTNLILDNRITVLQAAIALAWHSMIEIMQIDESFQNVTSSAFFSKLLAVSVIQAPIAIIGMMLFAVPASVIVLACRLFAIGQWASFAIFIWLILYLSLYFLGPEPGY